MPLTMLAEGKEAVVHLLKAKEGTKKFLEGLGLIPGTPISVISELDGNLIIALKGSRIAINRGLAQKVLVQI
jgi:ferrous iron transport protein A